MSTPGDDRLAEGDAPCRFGTHAPRDCPARVFALRGTTAPACPIPITMPAATTANDERPGGA